MKLTEQEIALLWDKARQVNPQRIKQGEPWPQVALFFGTTIRNGAVIRIDLGDSNALRPTVADYHILAADAGRLLGWLVTKENK